MHMRESDPRLGKPCLECGSDTANSVYRCQDCIGAPLLCQPCIVDRHRWSPFHQIQKWNGRHFESTTLAALGFVLRLGHYGQPCPALTATEVTQKVSNLTIAHTTGLQEIQVQYCECVDSAEGYQMKPRPLQLWSHDLWPATCERTRTVFSRHALRFFYHLSMQSKVSAYDYMGTLQRLTDNGFMADVKVGLFLPSIVD